MKFYNPFKAHVVYNRLSTKHNGFMLKNIPKNTVKVFHDYND